MRLHHLTINMFPQTKFGAITHTRRANICHLTRNILVIRRGTAMNHTREWREADPTLYSKRMITLRCSEDIIATTVMIQEPICRPMEGHFRMVIWRNSTETGMIEQHALRTTALPLTTSILSLLTEILISNGRVDQCMRSSARLTGRAKGMGHQESRIQVTWNASAVATENSISIYFCIKSEPSLLEVWRPRLLREEWGAVTTPDHVKKSSLLCPYLSSIPPYALKFPQHVEDSSTC